MILRGLQYAVAERESLHRCMHPYIVTRCPLSVVRLVTPFPCRLLRARCLKNAAIQVSVVEAKLRPQEIPGHPRNKIQNIVQKQDFSSDWHVTIGR